MSQKWKSSRCQRKRNHGSCNTDLPPAGGVLCLVNRGNKDDQTNLGKASLVQTDSALDLQNGKIPRHVAIIMDGNGRWAKEHGLPRVAGHHSGMKNVKKIAIAANAIGVKVLTLYAFSTENWVRPKEEVDFCCDCRKSFFRKRSMSSFATNIRVV